MRASRAYHLCTATISDTALLVIGLSIFPHGSAAVSEHLPEGSTTDGECVKACFGAETQEPRKGKRCAGHGKEVLFPRSGGLGACVS